MLIIGLTGSVGMGKTETGNFFKEKSIDVFDCDKEIKEFYKNLIIQKKLKTLFPSIFHKDKIDKIALAKLVFNSKEHLNKLEKIFYKKLKKAQSFWIRKKIREKKNIIVFDVPLLFEKDNLNKYDLLIVVSCKKSIQKVRVLRRKGWDIERLNKTLEKQMPDYQKKKLADIIINTDRGKRHVFNQIQGILKFIKYIENRSINNILKEF